MRCAVYDIKDFSVLMFSEHGSGAEVYGTYQ
jgi:hypothetical protein